MCRCSEMGYKNIHVIIKCERSEPETFCKRTCYNLMRAKRKIKIKFLKLKLHWCERSERKFFRKFCAFTPNSSKLRSDYLFFSRRGQIIYSQHFQGQNIYFQKVPAPPPPSPQNQMVVPLPTSTQLLNPGSFSIDGCG